jgi:hypothetical protein
MRRNLAVPIAALVVVGWTLVRLAPLQAQTSPIPRDTIFAASTNTADHNEIWKITPGKAPEVFANVNPGDDPGNGEYPWIGPIGVGPNGHLYVATDANSGTLWDVTAGGDRTSDKPHATAIFKDQPSKMDGMAFDAAGNVYLDSSEQGAQPIMKVTPDGKFSALKGTYNLPKGLAVKKDANNKEILYIVQGGDATVQSYNLTDDQPGTQPFAKGFTQLDNHVPGSIVVDHQGRILVLWRTRSDDANNANENSGALFDITNGGDFSAATPLVKTQFRMDVNQMAVDSQNNVYIAGNDSHSTWMSKFDSSTGKYATCVAIAGNEANLGDVGDSEAVAVAP